VGNIDSITYIPVASKKLFMVLLTSPLRQVGKNTNSIFEAVFFCCIILLSPGTGNRKPCRLPAALSRGFAHHEVLRTSALGNTATSSIGMELPSLKGRAGDRLLKKGLGIDSQRMDWG
jgi:hypothetical protein